MLHQIRLACLLQTYEIPVSGILHQTVFLLLFLFADILYHIWCTCLSHHIMPDTICLCIEEIQYYRHHTRCSSVSGMLHQMRFAYLLQTYCTPVSGILRQTLLQTYLITADIPVCPDILHQIRFACVPQTYCFTSATLLNSTQSHTSFVLFLEHYR